jgi:hypothetical protein
MKIRAEINDIQTNKQKNIQKNQRNKNLVLWKNEQDWKTPIKSD